MRALLTILVLAIFSIAGCSKKDGDKGDGDKPATADAAAKTPAPTPDATATAGDGDGDGDGDDDTEDLPTSEDFEEEAAKAISDKNLEKELADLEGELKE